MKLEVLACGDSEQDDVEEGQNNESEGNDGNDGVGEQEHGDHGVSNSSLNTSLHDASPAQDVEGRPIRNRRQPTYLQDYVSGEGLGLSDEEEELHSLAIFCANEDPVTYDEAKMHSKWRNAMKSGINVIERNNTWELVVLPKGVKTIGVKWVFKTKYNEHGDVDKCKARLVAKEYAQHFGIDYTEVYAPVARWDTIRMIVALAA